MRPSGCGKTAFMNCFSGIDDATSGEILIGGKNSDQMSDNEKSIIGRRATHLSTQ